MLWGICVGHRRTSWSWFSLSTVVWVPGIELSLSGLCGEDFIS